MPFLYVQDAQCLKVNLTVWTSDTTAFHSFSCFSVPDFWFGNFRFIKPRTETSSGSISGCATTKRKS